MLVFVMFNHQTRQRKTTGNSFDMYFLEGNKPFVIELFVCNTSICIFTGLRRFCLYYEYNF